MLVAVETDCIRNHSSLGVDIQSCVRKDVALKCNTWQSMGARPRTWNVLWKSWSAAPFSWWQRIATQRLLDRCWAKWCQM